MIGHQKFCSDSVCHISCIIIIPTHYAQPVEWGTTEVTLTQRTNAYSVQHSLRWIWKVLRLATVLPATSGTTRDYIIAVQPLR